MPWISRNYREPSRRERGHRVPHDSAILDTVEQQFFTMKPILYPFMEACL
jgi:hypothetical protein